VDRDLQDKYAQTDKEIYEEARDFLSLCEDSESDNRKRGLLAKKFRDGDQWPETLYAAREAEGGRLSLTINYTDLYVERIENQLKQQRPRIKCHPVGEGADVETAEVVNGLTRHIENRSQASVAYDAAASSALDIGWGFARLISEYVDEKSFDQELRIVPILNTFTVYRDPDSVLPDGSDSMRYLISFKVTRRQFKQRYPAAELVDFIAGGLGDDLEWESHESVRLAEYFRITEVPERLFKMKDGSTRYESEFEKGVLEKALKDPRTHGFHVERDGKHLERPSVKRQVEWYKLTGKTVIDRRVLPGRYIPIVACQGKVLDIQGKRSRKGMIENLMEPARMVNYWETMKTERLALAPKSEWTAYEGVIDGHNEWHDANRKSYSVLVGKAVQGPNGETLPLPTKTAPAQVEAGMSEAMQSAYSGLMAMAGQPHDPGQDTRGEVVSGVALAERRELADISHFQYYDNQLRMIDFMGRLILDWIPVTYSSERMQRIISEDGKPQMIKINDPGVDKVKNDLTIGQYAVVMDTGPGYDTKRKEGADVLTQVVKGPMGEVVAQKAPDLYFRSLDTAYSEQIADRLAVQVPEELKKMLEGLPDKAKTIIGQMQQQVQQLTAKVQEQEMDIKHGLTKTLHQEATKLQVEHLRDKRAEHDTLLDVGTKRFDTEVKSHTDIGVAEINAGAKLIDSNQDRKHEKELAATIAASAEKAEKSNGTH
jgi:hypothetical protein